jgi:monovalent cation:H+ antiporter-2, CPA2 family
MSDPDVGLTSLRAMPLFAGVSEHDLQSILKMGRLRSYEPGQSIVRRGELGDALYVILRGTASVEVVGDSQSIDQGHVFGEMALMGGKERTATVKAAEPVQALEIGAEDFQRFLLQHPQVGLAMLKSLIGRWREVQGRLEAWVGTG